VKGLPVTTTLIVVAIVVVLLVVSVLIYNSLVRRRNHVDNAWSQIDVQLKRRYDLIPNLVETVKGYAAHERGTLEAVTERVLDAENGAYERDPLRGWGFANEIPDGTWGGRGPLSKAASPGRAS